jgi:MFS family permease
MSKNHSLTDTFRLLSGNTLIFALTGMLGNMARRMVFPYASLFILALGGDATQVGLINSLRPLAGLITFPVAGYIADRASRVRLIVLANYWSAVVISLYFVAPSWELIAIGGLLQGFSVMMFPARSALIADSLAPGDRGRGIAAMSTIMTGPAIVAPYIAGVVVDRFGTEAGVRALYGVMLGLYLASAVIHQRFLREALSRPPERLNLSRLPKVVADAYREIPTTLRQLPRSLRALAAVILLNFMINAVASPFWVVYAVEEIGLSSSAWGLILLVETVLGMVLFVPAGMVVDRWGRTTSLLTAFGLATVCIPAFVLASDFVGVLLVRTAVAVAYVLAMPASSALMADLVPREMRGRVMAALGRGGIIVGPVGGGTGGPSVGFVFTIPLMLASLFGGLLYSANPTYPWLFGLGATLLQILLTARFVRDPKRAQE